MVAGDRHASKLASASVADQAPIGQWKQQHIGQRHAPQDGHAPQDTAAGKHEKRYRRGGDDHRQPHKVREIFTHIQLPAGANGATPKVALAADRFMPVQTDRWAVAMGRLDPSLGLGQIDVDREQVLPLRVVNAHTHGVPIVGSSWPSWQAWFGLIWTLSHKATGREGALAKAPRIAKHFLEQSRPLFSCFGDRWLNYGFCCPESDSS